MLNRREFLHLSIGGMLGLTLPAQGERQQFFIQPIAPYKQWGVEGIADTITSVLQFDVAVLPPLNVPASAKDAHRGRYHAPSIVYALGPIWGLAVTDVDICQPHDHPELGCVPDWGVIGVAPLGGPTGIISTRRIRNRAWMPVIAVHETGHLLGYDDCDTPRCQMLNVYGDAEKYSTMQLGWFCDTHVK